MIAEDGRDSIVIDEYGRVVPRLSIDGRAAYLGAVIASEDGLDSAPVDEDGRDSGVIAEDGLDLASIDEYGHENP